MKIKNIFIIAAILIMSVPFLQSCDDESTSKLSFEIICEDTIAPCIVHLKNTSIGYDNFFWEFGDGSTSEEKNPTHEYETDSTYEVILRDKDNNANYVKKTFKVYDYRDKWIGEYEAISNGSVLLYVKSYIITPIKDSTIKIDICRVYQKEMKVGEDWHALELDVSTDGIIYLGPRMGNNYQTDYYGCFYAEDSVKLTYPYWDLEGEGEIIFKGKKIKN